MSRTHQSSGSRKSPRPAAGAIDALPEWIFDVDEEDHIEGNSSLLQELEIYPSHIYKCIIWMLIGPFVHLRLFGKPFERHPLYISYNNSNTSANRRGSIDFWGPCAVVSVYGLILWLGKVWDVPWIYVIWTVAAVFNHVVSRVWYSNSSIMIHIALLGYSVTSIIPFAAFILFIQPPVWMATLFEVLMVAWASLAAILSYSMIFYVSSENKSRIFLLFPPTVLMEMYFISLIPITSRTKEI